MDNTQKIKWGIIGAGIIAKKMANALKITPNCQLCAVASKTPSKARMFADENGVENAYNYQEIVNSKEIDVIYVATTHNFHFDNAKLALKHGKHVLIEKSFTVNANEARELVRIALEKNLFLMEAMWTRFLPHILKVQQMINDGLIGQPRILQASVGDQKELDPSNRFFNPKLGGGSLIDVGIYAATLAHLIFGPPTAIQTLANLSSTGKGNSQQILQLFLMAQLLAGEDEQ